MLISDELLEALAPKEEWCVREVFVPAVSVLDAEGEAVFAVEVLVDAPVGVAAVSLDVVDLRASWAADWPCSAAASISALSSGDITTSIVDVKSYIS